MTNPGTGVSALASKRVKALITNVKRPKVSKLTGSDNKTIMGRIKALTKPIAIAPVRADTKVVTLNPGTTLAVSSNAIAVLIQVNKKCFM
jgi:hypothetical protein